MIGLDRGSEVARRGRPPLRIGLIVPSSNTTIERVVASGALDSVTETEVVVTRIAVTTIAPGPSSARQFEPARLLDAARLLADASPSSITWTGTSGLWLGVEAEAEVLAQIESSVGVPTTSAAGAMLTALRDAAPEAIALCTPYVPEIASAVARAYTRAGFRIAAEEHFGIVDNAAFADISVDTLGAAVARLAPFGLVSVACTNLCCLSDGEVVDSTLAMLWHAMAAAGGEPATPYSAFADLVLPVLRRALVPSPAATPGRGQSG